MRSLRVLALAHSLGHTPKGEQDRKIDLLRRLMQHGETTARYTVYWGEDRDSYDIRGRTAHESLFNAANGTYRCPGTQQGYSPFSTWTRGLAWAILGYAEQLEYLSTLPEAAFACLPEIFDGSKHRFMDRFLDAATATADFYMENTAADGIPYWDTGAPGLSAMPDRGSRPADPYNDHEPVDSTAAAITAQGMLRLGNVLAKNGGTDKGKRYIDAALTIANVIFDTPYLSEDENHQGLLLHSIYHRPNGWDYVPPGRKIPNGESSMWGDYHARELALMILKEAKNETYYDFFSAIV